MTAPPLLAPPPRRYVAEGAPARIPDDPGARVPAILAGSPVWRRIDRALARAQRGRMIADAANPWLRAEIADADLGPEGYRLEAGADGVRIVAGTQAGLRYGLTTLAGLLEQPRDGAGGVAELAGVSVDDRPDVAHRGLLLDISRNKVPTMETLTSLVELLGALKLNQLQLYTEHTFAYAGHERVWRDASPLTAGEVQHLDRLCSEHGIELVPNQNSFGHLHRWLVHEPYRALAECPEGLPHAWSVEPEPFSLCPTDPAALDLLEDLYAQLLPNFRSRLFNVGLDETFDLGLGRSRSACEKRGRGEVYLDFLRAVHGRVSASGHRMMFWGDIVVEHPEIAADLPADAIALLWGYEAGHPFAEQCALMAASGLEFYVCPGTSSWNSFAGRWANARDNCAAAARAAVAHGASGYLITDWGDNGHLQPLPASYPALVAAACFAWNVATADRPEELPIAELLNDGVLAIPCAGTLLALADAYRGLGVELRNGTVPFRLLMSVDDSLETRGMHRLEPQALATRRGEVAGLRSSLGRLEASDAGGRLLQRELDWTARILELALELGELRLGSLPHGRPADLPVSQRARLALRLEELTAVRRELWHARHRPGGWSDTASRLEAVRANLVATA